MFTKQTKLIYANYGKYILNIVVIFMQFSLLCRFEIMPMNKFDK